MEKTIDESVSYQTRKTFSERADQSHETSTPRVDGLDATRTQSLPNDTGNHTGSPWPTIRSASKQPKLNTLGGDYAGCPWSDADTEHEQHG